jgi:hypothetical protein
MLNKNVKMDTLKWVTNWFSGFCDGDWEHENQIKIYTVSNPGWSITIDLTYTPLSKFVLKSRSLDKGADDWYFYQVEQSKFTASGDLNKIDFLLNEFRNVVEANC